MNILKGVQYFTKNIVIQPVPIHYQSGKKSTSSGENMSSNKSDKDRKEKSKFITSNIIYTSGKESKSGSGKKAEKTPWKVENRNEEDLFLGTASSDQETLSESMLKAIKGYDENTKFYHKEITIRPVFIPPPKFNK